MPLFFTVPVNDPKLHHQKELSHVSDEEYESYFKPIPCDHKYYNILRWIYFFVFLGPLRIIHVIFFVFLFFIVVSILPLFKRSFKTPREFKIWGQKILYPIVRIGMIGLGVVKITKNGELKNDTRTLVVNHLTMIDALVVMSQFDCSFLTMSGVQNLTLFRKASLIFDLIFVDRSKMKQGTTQHIQKVQNDPSVQPIVIFPEGKVTNGNALIGFRSGAFVNNTPLQPMTFQYKHWLCPKGMSSIAWNQDKLTDYIISLFSIPFITIEITIHPQIVYKGNDQTPAERAADVELQMANYLGCVAVQQTNKEFYMKHKED